MRLSIAMNNGFDRVSKVKAKQGFFSFLGS